MILVTVSSQTVLERHGATSEFLKRNLFRQKRVWIITTIMATVACG